jgi:hypothetical protein
VVAEVVDPRATIPAPLGLAAEVPDPRVTIPARAEVPPRVRGEEAAAGRLRSRFLRASLHSGPRLSQGPSGGTDLAARILDCSVRP